MTTGRRPLSLMAPMVAVAAAAAATFALAGCSAIEFYWQGITGQVDLLARAKPMGEIIETTPDPALKARLERVRTIRAFASRELALPDNRSYTTYADLGRPFVVWNVFAAPELSLSPRQWCFPVAGCVAYRGYFAEGDARAEAARLAEAGDDIHLGGVPAYSTLGYFDDPVLSTFIRFREVELARLVFHELAHQVVYVKDDTSFNESFATAVEEAGLERWLAAERATRGAAAVAELEADAARGRRIRAEFRAMIAATRERLAALYAGTASDDEKRAGKAAAFAAMRADVTASPRFSLPSESTTILAPVSGGRLASARPIALERSVKSGLMSDSTDVKSSRSLPSFASTNESRPNAMIPAWSRSLSELWKDCSM